MPADYPNRKAEVSAEIRIISLLFYTYFLFHSCASCLSHNVQDIFHNCERQLAHYVKERIYIGKTASYTSLFP